MESSPNSIRIRAPDDFHLHLRDGHILQTVAPLSAQVFSRAIIMPNLTPPVRNLQDALQYRQRILEATINHAPKSYNTDFQPLMTLYLTDQTTRDIIKEAATHSPKVVYACKLYPAGATTNSAFGVTALDKIKDALSEMEAQGLILCIHGEVVREGVDFYDRERVFVTQVLPPLLHDHPNLKVVLEHVTTKEAVDFVVNYPHPHRLAATVTPQHLLYNRNALFENGKLHPHRYCLPILKTEQDRSAILDAVMSDDPKISSRFFLGTDSAPHLASAKHAPGCAAGVFSAGSWALSMYAQVFDKRGKLHLFQAFASENGAAFYGLPLNESYLVLERRSWNPPAEIHLVQQEQENEQVPQNSSLILIPVVAGMTLEWSTV